MFKKGSDYYIPRIKNAVEQVFIRDQDEPHDLDKWELLEKIWSADSKYEKFVSLLRIAKDVLPESLTDFDREKLKDFLYSLKELPFNPEKFNFESLDDGGQSKVFLLETREDDRQSFVLKILMPDKDRRKPMEQVENLRKEYEFIKELYKEVPDLIPNEYFLMLSDPMNKNRVAPAMIQPFLGKEMKDFFSLSVNDLRRGAKIDPVFEKQIKEFSRITLDHERKTRGIVDFFGPKNISVIKKNGGKERLILLDPHGIISNPNELDGGKKEKLKKRLEFLKQFLDG